MENLFYGEKHSFIEWTYDVGAHWMRLFQCLPTAYATEIKKPILKYTLNRYHVHWLSSGKHLKLTISIEIPVTILQIVYIYMTALSPNLIT